MSALLGQLEGRERRAECLRNDKLMEAGLVCQACAGDAPDGKCQNPKCIGGPIVRELVPVAQFYESCGEDARAVLRSAP